LALGAFVTPAQDVAAVPSANDLYCSGVVTSEAVPQSSFIITGQESDTTLQYMAGDTVFINKGSKQGITAGQQFSVIRPAIDPVEVDWTKWQTSIFQKMGTLWEDEGRITVVSVRPDVSLAKVSSSCNPMQRGDVILPLMDRPVPPPKPEFKFERYTLPNGKKLAMAVIGKRFSEEASSNDVVYVNLGSQQGMKVGDYFRFFRYTGQHNEAADSDPRFAFAIDKNLGPTFGFGGVSKNHTWQNTPRENVGEGVIIRTGPNSSTVMITYSYTPIFMGDYAEAE
jgi:hypothetical protein